MFVCKKVFKSSNMVTMKRTVILSFLILLSFSVWSQNFRLGFQASPQLMWMNSTNNNIQREGVTLGIKYGLEADIYLAGFPRYSLNTGLFVSHQSFSAIYNVPESFSINESTFDEQTELNFKMNYIEIPLIIKLKSDQFYRMRFYGQFGLSNLLNIGASATSSDSGFSGENINESVSNRTIHMYNLCMVIGGGAEYDLGGNTAINLGIQYSNGLTDVTNISNLSEKTVLNSLRLVLGIMF